MRQEAGALPVLIHGRSNALNTVEPRDLGLRRTVILRNVAEVPAALLEDPGPLAFPEVAGRLRELHSLKHGLEAPTLADLVRSPHCR